VRAGRVWPPLEKFSCKKMSKGDQGKNLPPSFDFFKEILKKTSKGGPKDILA
jgi:hypothetical protein